MRNLQWVLSNDTEMRSILLQNGVKFDVDEKKMYVLHQEYDIDYEKYRGVYNLSEEEENIERIAHKVYYDFQINAFLFCEDISKYSTVCEMPEFLYTLSNFSKDVQEVANVWKKDRKAYVIKYRANIEDFAYFTFYESDEERKEDVLKNYITLKKHLISLAIEGMNGELPEDVFAYMNPETIISPENIIEIVSAEEWRSNVLKYFGKTGNI